MPRMSELSPVQNHPQDLTPASRIHLTQSADAVISRARALAQQRHETLALSHVSFACMLDENFFLSLESSMGYKQANEALRQASEALDTPSSTDFHRLFSMAKWIHGKGEVETQDLSLAASRLAELRSPHKPLKKAV